MSKVLSWSRTLGIILLAGLIVGCTVFILEEIRSLKEDFDRISNK